jgi:hypothetical protein
MIQVLNGQTPTGPPPDPAALAAQAVSKLVLPAPTLGIFPFSTTMVGYPTWMWLTNPTIWAPETTTATATNAGGSTTVSATATPVDVLWSTGQRDVPPVDCPGPGVAYNNAIPLASQHTDCKVIYAQSSKGQPTPNGNPNCAQFPVTATMGWKVTWTGPGGSGGQLPSLYATGATNLRVEQVEAVNTYPGEPRPSMKPPVC